MTRAAIHARIPVFPYAKSLQGARLDDLRLEAVDRRRDLVLDYHEFVPAAPSRLFERDGQICEGLRGRFIPRRLRFAGTEELEIGGVYRKLEDASADHPAREIRNFLTWIQAGQNLPFYLLISSSRERQDGLRFYARRVLEEKRPGKPIPVSFERDWSPAPPARARIIPFTPKLYERFGGDPIATHLDGRVNQRCLFIGGLETQPSKRPDIDAVLNLGEKPSRWAKGRKLADCDRWAHKGEGRHGTNVEDIRREAEWVVERLKAGKRVLVHCVAGRNRSSTICCAALILLEGLSAEQALERVREHHLWAGPDSYYWLKLRWLAENKETT